VLAAATPSIFVTGTLLFAFRPEGRSGWDYDDQIWSPCEDSEGQERVTASD
jgi:hypothetical protein